MIRLYTLAEDGETEVRCSDPMKWGAWFGSTTREFARAMAAGTEVLATFIGADVSDEEEDPPHLWEVAAYYPSGAVTSSKWKTKHEAMTAFLAKCDELEELADVNDDSWT